MGTLTTIQFNFLGVEKDIHDSTFPGKFKIEPKLLPIDCSLPGDMEQVKRVLMLRTPQSNTGKSTLTLVMLGTIPSKSFKRE